MSELKKYTKQEFSNLENSAIDNFQSLKQQSLETYSDFLENLLRQDKASNTKINEAALKRQFLYNELGVFIQENYVPEIIPQKSGVHLQTVESILFSTLSNLHSESDTEFQELYLSFHEKILSQEASP